MQCVSSVCNALLQSRTTLVHFLLDGKKVACVRMGLTEGLYLDFSRKKIESYFMHVLSEEKRACMPAA